MSRFPKMYIEYEVKKDDKVIDSGKVEGQTWVANIIRLLACMLSVWAAGGSGYCVPTRYEIVDIGGAVRPTGLGCGTNLTIGGAAPTGDTSAGILVGTGDTPVSLTQYNLASLITHGSGAGQLSYGATTVETTAVSATEAVFRVVRTFSNNSGADVVVKEVGLFMKLGMSSSPFVYTAMLARDVLPTPITVPPGATLTVRYVIRHSL